MTEGRREGLSEAQRDRFDRQARVAKLGAEGQARLLASRVAIVGCGALGCSQASLLARAGVGSLRLIDRDIVELSNLHRQRLFTTEDARTHRPKAIAARDRLAAVADDAIELDARIVDLTPREARGLLEGVDLVLDGTDNFETRFVIDEACHELGTPWVHAAVVGTAGQVMAIAPGRTACYRCYLDQPPPPGSYDTCDTAGVLGPAVDIVAATAVTEAIKLLLGHEPAGKLLVIDAWTPRIERLAVRRRPGCPACAGERQWLRVDAPLAGARLCGRDAVQLPARGAVDLAALEARLATIGTVRATEGMLRFAHAEGDLPFEILLFDDGRAIVRGTDKPERARSLYARYIG